MAFLFVSLFYLCAILFYSISCHSSDRNEDTPGWHHESHGGIRIAEPTYGEICNRYSHFVRTQKLICLLCKGLDPSCLSSSMSHMASTSSTSTAPTTTTSASPTTTMAAATTTPAAAE